MSKGDVEWFGIVDGSRACKQHGSKYWVCTMIFCKLEGGMVR